jgi:hypothetical protein
MIDGAYVSGAEASGIVVGVDHHPDHGPLDRPVSTRIHACVCGSCGFVEFYANKPVELYDAYRRAERRAASGR